MSLKKTDLAKNLGLKISQTMKKAGVPGRFAQGANQLLDRKERRKLEQAEGLMPFACKLHADLISTLRQLAEQEGGNLNAVTERLLRAGLAAGGSVVVVAETKAPELIPQKAAVKTVSAKKGSVAKPAEKKPAVKKAADKKAADKAIPVKKAAAAPKAAAKKAPAKKAPAKKAGTKASK